MDFMARLSFEEKCITALRPSLRKNGHLILTNADQVMRRSTMILMALLGLFSFIGFAVDEAHLVLADAEDLPDRLLFYAMPLISFLTLLAITGGFLSLAAHLSGYMPADRVLVRRTHNAIRQCQWSEPGDEDVVRNYIVMREASGEFTVCDAYNIIAFVDECDQSVLTV